MGKEQCQKNFVHSAGNNFFFASHIDPRSEPVEMDFFVNCCVICSVCVCNTYFVVNTCCK